ncbi:universal stress protein [Halegenticoccus tardaugens]|uniref:universal stress protein n=1 Tax=Halegenticoccus tardaugens TaxID=2071624 RepID=UPI00100AE692|nr:universal stress protein [Halegenticoccus tardaugens]
MYDTILLPTDGSEGAHAAAEHAFDIARRYDGVVHVLYVADTNRDSLTVVGDEAVDALEEEGQAVVEEVVRRAGSVGVETVTAVVQGGPHRTILDYVDEYGVDLVVMATHGRRGLERYLLGSVTERVVRTSPAPVLTVRTAED